MRKIRAGDLYEDCTYHPCRAVRVDPFGWRWQWRHPLRTLPLPWRWADADIQGQCLLTAEQCRWHQQHGCSWAHCAPEYLTPGEAEYMRLTWPAYVPKWDYESEGISGTQDPAEVD